MAVLDETLVLIEKQEAASASSSNNGGMKLFDSVQAKIAVEKLREKAVKLEKAAMQKQKKTYAGAFERITKQEKEEEQETKNVGEMEDNK